MAEPQGILFRTDAVDDCWRRIGIRGDGSCPALAEHAHCRNCPTYAQAAATLLDVQGLDALLDELPDAATLAEDDPDQSAARGAAQSCLVFRIGDEWLALPTAALGEVTAPAPVHSLPHRRDAAVLGLAAVRGNLLACLSLARLFDASGATADTVGNENGNGSGNGSRFLILGQGRAAIALPVAEVSGIARVPLQALQPLPATLARASARYTQALFDDKDRTVGLLDEALVRRALTRSLA
ncbi:chemotaxis protein CheW [Cupriavidus necator]|uniref:chemotaxis protein CheW n=1 Tax=Cupriavidus necator TaxID=106590 RepID=UPI0039C2774D